MMPLALEHHLQSRLKFKQLKLLITVGEERNILRASQMLNMAQPAATKTIRELETTLNVELFTRSSRGVTPTLYGEIIIKHAKLILSQLRHASEELLSLQEGISGKITVGTLLAASAVLLPRAIALTRRERPNISIAVVEGTNDKLMPMLRVGDLDLVVGRLPEYREREGLSQEALYHEPVPIVARAGHPLANRKNLSFADLADQHWILPPPQTSLRRQLEIAFRKAGVEPPTNAIESVSMLANHTLLLESDMIAAIPYQVAESQTGLCRLPLSVDAAKGPVGITVRGEGETTPAASYFRSALRQVASEIVESQVVPQSG